MRKTISALFITFVFATFLQAQTTQKVTVQVNQQKTPVKSKITIKFVSLVEDSRCPTDAQCIQAGTAKIQVELKKVGSGTKTLEMNTNGKPKSVTFAGYTIQLIDVNPKPATNIRINRNGYTATFVVSKS